MDARDMEGCHQLPLSMNCRGHNKMAIVKFVTQKYAEALLKDKKQVSLKNFSHLYVPNKVFLSVSLCPYRFIWVNVRICKGKGRFTMFFCLGDIVCIKLLENGSPVKLHHIRDIPNFPLDSDIEN